MANEAVLDDPMPCGTLGLVVPCGRPSHSHRTGSPSARVDSYYPRFGLEVATSRGVEMRFPRWAPPGAAMARVAPGLGVSPRGRLVYAEALEHVEEN